VRMETPGGIVTDASSIPPTLDTVVSID